MLPNKYCFWSCFGKRFMYSWSYWRAEGWGWRGRERQTSRDEGKWSEMTEGKDWTEKWREKGRGCLDEEERCCIRPAGRASLSFAVVPHLMHMMHAVKLKSALRSALKRTFHWSHWSHCGSCRHTVWESNLCQWYLNSTDRIKWPLTPKNCGNGSHRFWFSKCLDS